MDLLLPRTDEEAYVSSEAIRALRLYREDLKNQEEFLKTKKFQLGSIVTKINTCGTDRIFGLGVGDIGKVVGYDLENDYYRVFFDNYNSYIGIKEDRLIEYDGEVPEIVSNKDPWEITRRYFSA